jgi:phage-related protein
VATRFIHQFFTFPASAQTQGSEPPRVLTAKFGDGYQQRSRDGDINRLQVWNLVFTDRNADDLKVIDDFLDSFHGVDAFVWKPPNPFGPRWFTCKDWRFEYGDGDLITSINAVFEELVGPALAERLIIISGNFQTAALGAALAQPLVVQVLDSANLPVLGFHLVWEVLAGGGHLTSSISSTGADGKAQATLTLGPVALTNEVQVTAAGLGGSPAIFLEYATPPLTDNWAGNDFDFLPLGPTTDVLTETNVGDTSLGGSFFVDDSSSANWAGVDFDSETLGAISAPAGDAGVGDTSIGTGAIS